MYRNNQLHKIRVLITDDHTLFREGIKSLLERDGDIECISIVPDGEQAVRLSKELLPDIALIDIAMPKIDGIETAKQIKESCPKTAVVMLSAYKHDIYVRTCMDIGVDGYLLKDIPPDALRNAIRLVHSGGHVFSLETTKMTIKPAANNREADTALDKLSDREIDIIRLAARGMSNQELGKALFISQNTIRSHFFNIYKKLRVKSRTNAILRALKLGYISISDIYVNGREEE